MNRSVWLPFALLALAGCGGAAPASQPPPAASAAPVETTMPSPVAPTASASASSVAEPAPSASGAAIAPPVEAAAQPPAASTSRKAVLTEQIKGTPLAVLYVTDAAAATCGAKPTEGSTMLELSLYWKPGTYVIGTRTKTASIRVRRFEGGAWKTLPDVVKGEVGVVEAPIEAGKTGRIHIRGDRAGQAIDDELDVVVCAAFDPSKAR